MRPKRLHDTRRAGPAGGAALWTITAAALFATAPVHAQNVSYIGDVQLSIDAGMPITTPDPRIDARTDPLTGAAAVSETAADHGGTAAARAASGSSSFVAALARVLYNFRIVGAPNVDVPVRIQATGHAEGGGDGQYFAQAEFALDERTSLHPTPIDLFTRAASAPVYGAGPGFALDAVFLLRSGVDHDVYLDADVWAEGSTALTTATAYAFVDPIFTIDAAYADRFTLVGIPGSDAIGPPPIAGAVPEPAVWTMLMVGFGVVGATRRRTRPVVDPCARRASRIDLDADERSNTPTPRRLTRRC